MSSANSFIWESATDGKSLMNMMNNIGLLPCGIPLDTGIHLDSLPFITTFLDLSVNVNIIPYALHLRRRFNGQAKIRFGVQSRSEADPSHFQIVCLPNWIRSICIRRYSITK